MSHDFFQRRAPNWLVALGLLLGAAALLSGNQPFGISWADALTGGTAAFIVFLALYASKLMGAGDVKFAAALGLWIGLKPIVIVWVGASLLAGLHALLFLGLQKWPISERLLQAVSMQQAGKQGIAKTKNIPYAAYMAITAIVWALLKNRNQFTAGG